MNYALAPHPKKASAAAEIGGLRGLTNTMAACSALDKNIKSIQKLQLCKGRPLQLLNLVSTIFRNFQLSTIVMAKLKPPTAAVVAF